MAVQFLLVPGLEAHGPAKEWAIIGEAVIFAALTTQVHIRSRLQSLHKGMINVHAEPSWSSQSEINPNDPAPVSSLDELLYKSFRLISPERFQVLEAVPTGALLIPCADVSQVDIAKDDPLNSPILERFQHAAEHRFEVVRMRMGLEQRNAERFSLLSDQLAPHTMESDPSAGTLVDIEQTGNFQPLPAGAIQRQR